MISLVTKKIILQIINKAKSLTSNSTKYQTKKLFISAKLINIRMMAENMMSKILVVLYAAIFPLNDLNPKTINNVPITTNINPNNKKGKNQNIDDLSARFDVSKKEIT